MALRTTSKPKQIAALAAGLLCVGLGFVGAVVPGMPTTIFLILALGCFRVGSPTMAGWLLRHRTFGPILRDWDENRWMSRRAKVFAIASMVIFGSASIWMMHSVYGRAFVVALIVAGIFTVLRVRTKPN